MRSLLPQRLAHRVPEIAAEADGHPLLLVEAARAAAEGEESSVPLAEMVERRLARASERAQRVFDLLCAADAPLAVRTVMAATGIEDGRAELRELVELRLVTRALHASGAEHEIAPLHDRVRRARRSRWRAPVATLHRALAARLEAGDDAERDLAAWHWDAAGESARAATAAAAAAARALDARAYERAAELYGLALRHDERVAWLRARGDALSAAGRAQLAADAYERGADLAEGTEAFELLALAADRRLRAGDLGRGVAVMDRVLATAGLRRPRMPRLAFVLGLVDELALGIAERQALPRRSDVDPATRSLLDASFAAITGLTWADSFTTAYFATRFARAAFARGDARDVVRALAVRCATHAAIATPSRRAQSELLAERATTLAEEHAPATLPFALVSAASAAHFTGRWGRCDALLDRLEEMLAEGRVRQDVSASELHLVRTVNATHGGTLERAWSARRAALQHAEDRGDALLARVVTLGPLALLPIAAGEADHVLARAQSTLEVYAVYPWAMIHTWAAIGATLAHLVAGELDRARAESARNVRRGRVDMAHVVATHRIASTYVDGCVALALAWERGDASHARIALRRARSLASEHLPHARAYAEVLRAGARGVERGRADAAAIARARSSLDAAGLDVWARALDIHLAALEGREPPRLPTWIGDATAFAYAAAPVVPR